MTARPTNADSMRILHIVDLSDHAGAAPLACATAIAGIAADHSVWTIGHAPLPPGFPARNRLFGAALGLPLLAWPGIRRALRQSRGSFDLVTCWSPDVLAALHAACPRPGFPVIGVSTTGPGRDPPAIAARIRRRALNRFTMACFSPSAADAWRHAGADGVRVLSPLLPFDIPSLPTRDAARATLGVQPHERLLALLSDPPHLADARRFAYLCGLLSVGGAPTVGLVSPRNAQIRRGARFVRDCGHAWRLVPSDAPLPEVLPACDAALIDIRVPPTHPLHTPPGEPEPTADALAASLAAQLGIPLVVARVPLAGSLRAAGIPVITAVDTTCLSLAASLFPLIDAPHAAPLSLPDHGALDVLRDLWLEKLNAPLPGFPLSPSAPVPPLVSSPVRLA